MFVSLLCFGCDSPDNYNTISNVSSTPARSTYNFTFYKWAVRGSGQDEGLDCIYRHNLKKTKKTK